MEERMTRAKKKEDIILYIVSVQLQVLGSFA